MRVVSGDAALRWVRKLERRGSDLASVEPRVRRIVDDVRSNGDRALRAYAKKWDGLLPKEEIRVPQAELEAAFALASPALRRALEHAAVNIRRFCEWQRPREWRRNGEGISLGQVVRPLEAV